jgi:hypothetical protein
MENLTRQIWHKVTETFGEFSPIVVCFELLFKKYKSSKNYWAQFVHGTSGTLIFGKKWVGLHFWRLFHKLIWSPWTIVRKSI